MILKKINIQHMVTSVATITKCNDIVIVGSGALIAAAKHLPADLMITDEVDLYVRDAADPEGVVEAVRAAWIRRSQANARVGQQVGPHEARRAPSL